MIHLWKVLRLSVLFAGGEPLSQNQREIKQNIHHFLQDCWMLYTRCQSGASVQVRNTANDNENLIWPHPLLIWPVRPSPLWKEVQNANCKNPACPQIIQSILHQVFETTTENQLLTDLSQSLPLSLQCCFNIIYLFSLWYCPIVLAYLFK